jgi:hypothetical protein
MKSKTFFKSVLAVHVIALLASAMAQHLQIRTYGTGEGLPQSEVFALMQDATAICGSAHTKAAWRVTTAMR